MRFQPFIVALVSLMAATWYANRAALIGPLPYHWATFVGVMAGVIALLSFTRLHEVDGLSGRLFLINIAAGWAVTSYGLLARKRLGAVVFLALLIVSKAGQWFFSPRLLSIAELLGLGITICVWYANFVYFRKRWPYMVEQIFKG